MSKCSLTGSSRGSIDAAGGRASGGTDQLAQLLGQLHVLTVVHRAVDNGYRVVCQGRLQHGLEIRHALHAIALGTEALGVLDEIRIAEVDMAAAAEGLELMPLDEAVLGVVPD